MRYFSCLLALTVLAAVNPVAAQTVLTGYDVSFSKAPGVDGTDPANQDSLTSNVILARSDSAGLYNAVSETGVRQLHQSCRHPLGIRVQQPGHQHLGHELAGS